MAEVKLLTMPGCSHCGPAKDLLERVVARDFPHIKPEIIDITEYPEEAQKYSLLQAPGLVINGQLVSSGGFDEPELKEILSKV